LPDDFDISLINPFYSLSYKIITRSGNSGSVIFDYENNKAIGIHVDGEDYANFGVGSKIILRVFEQNTIIIQDEGTLHIEKKIFEGSTGDEKKEKKRKRNEKIEENDKKSGFNDYSFIEEKKKVEVIENIDDSNNSTKIEKESEIIIQPEKNYLKKIQKDAPTLLQFFNKKIKKEIVDTINKVNIIPKVLDKIQIKKKKIGIPNEKYLQSNVFVFICNHCEKRFENHVDNHCDICKLFDVCEDCMKKNLFHPHLLTTYDGNLKKFFESVKKKTGNFEFECGFCIKMYKNEKTVYQNTECIICENCYSKRNQFK